MRARYEFGAALLLLEGDGAATVDWNRTAAYMASGGRSKDCFA